MLVFYYCVFFFKQKTAYEMRISDGSSDVCSSDLYYVAARIDELVQPIMPHQGGSGQRQRNDQHRQQQADPFVKLKPEIAKTDFADARHMSLLYPDRKSVV